MSRVGSSPRARGTRVPSSRPGYGVRLIPARAGNTGAEQPTPQGAPAHPRARGEHAHRRDRRRDAFGSSPRARGTRDGHLEPRRLTRLIPARAGNTAGAGGCRPCLTAHPRARGEHHDQEGSHPDSGGSSPRARGTPNVDRSPVLAVRLIPARAGNTQASRSAANHTTAHPRARGEHTAVLVAALGPSGSSPRARGTLFDKRIRRGWLQLIPARAGNTRSIWCSAAPGTAHPRARGEHDFRPIGISVETGSSPRARGTP